LKLKLTYPSQEDIPEAFRDLYTESDGTFKLTGIDGLVTNDDLAAAKRNTEAEREAHKKTKARMRHFVDMSDDQLTEATAKLDRFDELEAAAGGKLDDDKINDMVEKRINSRTAPLERQIAALTGERDEARTESQELKKEKTTRSIQDEVRVAATKLKLLPEAIDDAFMLADRVFEVNEEGAAVTKDNVGVTPGIGAEVWLTDLKDKRPHWWPTSSGGGATPGGGGVGGGNNPWGAKTWNLTAQGQQFRADPAKATQLAQAAGTTIGGARPAS
jgi:hypothetical protein